MVLLLAACSDFSLNFDGDPGKPFQDDSGGYHPPADSDTAAPVEEACNGVDDDGDGLVDEDWPDTDGDGFADCVDPGCGAPELTGATTIPETAACAGDAGTLATPVVDPYRFREQWHADFTMAAVEQHRAAPLVVYLDDDDGDGTIGPGDGPEILLAADTIRVYEGATGVLKREIAGTWYAWATPVVGDGDGDGIPEIYVVEDEVPTAMAPDGTRLWTSTTKVDNPGTDVFLSLTDLDGDGRPELLADNLVLDAATGALERTLPTPSNMSWRNVTAADLDRDGIQEILIGEQVYRADGTLWWDVGRARKNMSWILPVQADEDEEGEVVVIGQGFGVYDTDGTELVWVDLAAASGEGSPTAADFDGDGAMEVGFPEAYYAGFSVYELDGTQKWNVAAGYRGLLGGATAFDFEGGGAYDILYAADEATYVYDGATGAALYDSGPLPSPRYHDYPTIADVDEDGAAEVVSSSFSLATSVATLTVMEHDGAGWGPATPSWGVYDYTPTAIGSDNRVPTNPDPSWTTPGLWRAQSAQPARPGHPDLVVSILDHCVDDCEIGPGWLVLQVSNQGGLGVSDSKVDVYATTSGEFPYTTIDTGPVPAGTSLAAVAIELTPDVYNAVGFRAVVSHSTPTECDSTNDEATYTTEVCP